MENGRRGTLVFSGTGTLIQKESIFPGELSVLKESHYQVWPLTQNSVKKFLKDNLGKDFEVEVPKGKRPKRDVFLVTKIN